MKAQQDFVSKVIQEEEISFLRTLENGLKRFDAISNTKSQTVSGADAFELYDTYGFPFDLTRLIATEHQMQVDEEGFLSEMSKQKERSKAAAKQDTGDWVLVNDIEEDSQFIGYDQLQSTIQIVKYRPVKQKKGFRKKGQSKRKR